MIEKIKHASNTVAKNLKTYHQLILSAALIMALVLIVYGHDLEILMNEALQNEAMSHIILVPLLAFFLAYRKKELAKASLAIERLRKKTMAISLSEITGIALCLSALLLYWYGSYTFSPLEFHTTSLVIFIIGITLALFNIKTLIALIFPILFLLFLMPPPSSITYAAGAALGNFNTQASYTLLKIIGVPVTLSSEYGPPTIVLNPSAQFTVDIPCSGIYSLVAFAMFATFLVYIVRGSITKKIVLFPIGFLMLTILNVLRMSLIVFIAYHFGQAIAMTLFHTVSGWILIFVGMLLLLLIAERLLHLQIFRDKNKIASCPKCGDTLKSNGIFCSNCGKFLKNHQTKLPKEFWIKITALLLVSFLFILSLQAPVFAFAQGLTITTPNPETSTDVFPQVSDYQLKFLYRDQNFEKISGQDASLFYAYIPQNISNPTVYVLVGVASSITKLHSWEVCLVTWQTSQGYAPLVKVLESRDIQIIQNPPIIARYFVFEHPANYTQVTLYWYERALFNTGLTVEQKFVRISLIILAANPTTYHEHEKELLPFAQSIATYWEPLKQQSLFSLSVPLQQLLLAASIIFVIITGTAQYTREWRKKMNNLKIFEKFAPLSEKLLFQTIKKVNEETKATTETIAHALEQTTGKAPEPDELTRMLNHLQENGLVEIDIVNIKDNPQLVWKP